MIVGAIHESPGGKRGDFHQPRAQAGILGADHGRFVKRPYEGPYEATYYI